MSYQQLSSNIKYLRKRQSLTQAEVSVLCGSNSHQKVSHWETGYSIPQTEHLKILSELFGVTIDDLVRVELKESMRDAAITIQINKK